MTPGIGFDLYTTDEMEMDIARQVQIIGVENKDFFFKIKL